MPSSVKAIFSAAGLKPEGIVQWGSAVPTREAGVYVISLPADVGSRAGSLRTCPIDPRSVEALLQVRPELLMDGRRPTLRELKERISAFWLPDEVVLYIGLAGTSLSQRVSQYYKTPLGAARPHAGGWFLKVLRNLKDLLIHYARCDHPSEAEDRLLKSFCGGLSMQTKRALFDPDHPFPFANLEWPPGIRKAHGLTGTRGPL